MSKDDAIYFVGDNQAINRVGSSRMSNRGSFSASFAALQYYKQFFVIVEKYL